MRNSTLAIVISSLLLGGAVTAQAGPETTTSSADQQQQATSPSDTSTSATQDQANPEVGSPQSNVDEKATSGSYYPYSAGTVGDDPAEPKSTTASHDGKDSATPGATNRWMEADTDGDGYLSQGELAKVNPSLATSFDSIDVDKDAKLTRDELRVWHESHRASMDADQADPNRPTRTDTPTNDVRPNDTGTPDTPPSGQ
jgi:hypothetical protein